MYLVDTHVLLWVLTDDPRLGPRTRASLTASSTHVSSISILELRIKAMLGKLAVPDDLVARLPDQGLLLTSFSATDADAIRTFATLTHHDPFDRALLAQAYSAGWTLVTADRRLLDLGLDVVEDAGR